MNCVVKKGEEIIFASDGKWLHPLFEVEDFLKSMPFDPKELTLEDKIIGRGAAVLIVRMGIRTCHGKLVSKRALPVMERYGVRCTWDALTDALACQTETALTDGMSLEEAYEEISLRAGRSLP